VGELVKENKLKDGKVPLEKADKVKPFLLDVPEVFNILTISSED
jgi:hypothetical protein